MNTSIRKLYFSGLIASSISLVAVAGCGDDDDATGTGGSTAKGGASAGGTTAKGGTGGSNGGTTTGGSGGAAKGGSVGTGGSKAATGGSVGTGGTTSGGASGAGGEPVVEGGAAGAGGAAAGAGGMDMGSAGGTDMGGAGGNVSELACTAYCSAILATCSATADVQYPDLAHCQGSCAAFPTGAAAGNTLECRAQHVALAATAGVEPHCQHAGPAGIGPCGGPCPAYCSLMMGICPGKFGSEAACTTACEAVPGGVPASLMTDFTAPAPAGNTLACRIYHATNAAAATTVASHDMHCGHAAGESICVP